MTCSACSPRPATRPDPARGLRIAPAGLALIIAGACLLAADFALRAAHISGTTTLGQLGHLAGIPGIVAFIAAVCYPSAVMRSHRPGRHPRAPPQHPCRKDHHQMTAALIIGGGIAGPATAIALHKTGITATVFEAYPAGASDDAGAFLALVANGQDALAAIGILDPVLDASFPARTLRITDATRARRIDTTLGRDHPCPQTITRANLSRILRDQAASRDIPLMYGKRLTGLTRRNGRVTALFADGSTAEADLLIGADGIHSPVRALIDPAAPPPRYVGLTIACGYAEYDQTDGTLDGYQMIYGSRGFFGYTTAPDGRTWWFARIPAPELTPADLAAPTGHWRKTVAGTFTDDNSPAAAIINATYDRITVTSAYDIPTLPAWHNDTTIVIGDAAHATSPATTQGASLAIEDAATLAQCLRDHADIPDALGVYEKLRRERVERVVQSGASGDNPKPPVPGARQPSSMDWLLKHHIHWDAVAGLQRTDYERHA